MHKSMWYVHHHKHRHPKYTRKNQDFLGIHHMAHFIKLAQFINLTVDLFLYVIAPGGCRKEKKKIKVLN